MLTKLYNYVMNVFDKQRIKNGDLDTKADGVKSKVSRELNK